MTLSNWGSLPLMLEKGDLVGHIEELHAVDLDEDVWHQNSDTMMRTVNVDTVKSRQEELSLRLAYGEHSTLEDHKATTVDVY